RRRHTRSKRDWSSDVCSSDLLVAVVVDVPVLARLVLTDSQTEAALVLVRFLVAVPVGALVGGVALRRWAEGPVCGVGLLGACAEIGRASCRESGEAEGEGAGY